MDNMSFGSGSDLLGQGAASALNEAMARRQTGQMGVTAQQTPGSPGATPGMQPPMPPTGAAPTDPMAAGGAPGAPLPGAGGGAQPDSLEATLILKALDSRLKTISKIQGG
jgi:hypothetical protein